MVQPSVRTAVMAAARENRSLSYCMVSSCLAMCRCWISRWASAGGAAPHAASVRGAGLTTQHHSNRSEGPNARRCRGGRGAKMERPFDYPCVCGRGRGSPLASWRRIGPEVLFGRLMGCGAEPALRDQEARAIGSRSASLDRMNEPGTAPPGTASGVRGQRHYA
jgi:hypothetical protein